MADQINISVNDVEGGGKQLVLSVILDDDACTRIADLLTRPPAEQEPTRDDVRARITPVKKTAPRKTTRSRGGRR